MSNGNRIAATINGQNFTATYDAQDRLLTYGANTYTYNQNGERISKTNSFGTAQFAYNSFGLLDTYTLPDGSQVSNIRDADNFGIAGLVNGQLSSMVPHDEQGRRIGVLSPQGQILQRFLYGSKSNIPDVVFMNSGQLYKIISDHLGSPRVIVNATTGVVLETMQFDEFGQKIVDTLPGTIPFGFAGGIYFSSEFTVSFNNRVYEAETGRWLSQDPIGFAGGDTNLYGYVLADPVNNIDPSGLWGVTVGVGIGGYLGGGYDVSGGVYFGYQNGSLSGGLFGSGNTGFGYGGGVGVQGTYYPDACSISGSANNLNVSAGPATVTGAFDPNTGALTGYGLGLGYGTPKGISGTMGNTGTVGFSYSPGGSP